MWETIDLLGARVRLHRHWLSADAAQALFATLQVQLPWEVHRVRLFGREVDSPRLSCWIGDADAAYTYSGVRHTPQAWPAALRPVRERLTHELATPFNSVLANLYRDGNDAIGWHADDEQELGPQPVIAALSFGAARRFLLKPKSAAPDPSGVAQPALSLDLTPGSLLVMAGDTQHHYRHALPRTRRTVGARISLTFRHTLSARILVKDAEL